ncbi:HAD-IIA family hydrolase [Caenispirillum bisanense]|uniref:HAD-IIA family hydrolase n=1 Tax=Caenispirillum bisanense TaxID=414052 RepID=UPI0031D7D36D
MLSVSFDDAWRVYLDARPRLPAFPPPVTPRRVSGLLEVVADFDLVVFDAYGVLHVGGDALPQGLAAFRALRQMGKRLCIVTNDVTRGPDGVCQGLNARGYDLTPEEVISGRSLLPAIMDARPPGAWGVIATHADDIAARFRDCRPLGQEATAAEYGGVDGFLFVDNNFWTDAHPVLLETALAARPRPMIVCNPDVACPYKGFISLEPGYPAHVMAARGLTEVTFLGKPFRAVYDLVAQRFPDVPRDRMLMVGDSPHTDVLGARGAGMKVLLVEYGFLQGQDSLARCAEAGLLPDYVAEAP